MNTLIISKWENSFGHIDYELQTEGVFSAGLCWDEMLGAVARFLLRDWFVGISHWRRNHNDQCLYEIRIEQVGHNLYTIFHNERSIDQLTFDEALGTIASFTLTDRPLFSGFTTYEEWLQVPYQRKREIVGNLPAPEVIA